jgi:O-antigen biosynthesis protein
MRLAYPIYRLRQLIPTVRRIYRQEGSVMLFNRMGRWLMGERGYTRQPVAAIDEWERWASLYREKAEDLLYTTSARFLIGIIGQDVDAQSLTRSSLVGFTGEWIEVEHPTLLTGAMAQSNDSAEWLVLLRAGDTVIPHAKRWIEQAIQDHPDADVFYSDYLIAHKSQREPRLRPGLIGPLMMSDNLLAPIAIIRRTTFDSLNPILQTTWVGWLHAAALQLQRRTSTWVHIPQALVTISPPARLTPVEQSEMRDAIVTHLVANDLRAVDVRLRTLHNTNAVIPSATWALPEKHSISIIIPNRDHAVLIRHCLRGLLLQTEYDDFEVIVVDTGSSDPATWAVYKQFQDDPRFRYVIYQEKPFNFSRVCNVGAAQSTGRIFLFLNNDTQIIDSLWLHKMAQWFAWPKVGIVGARLLYPSGLLQHAGVTVGLWGLAGHPHANMTVDHMSLLGSDAWSRQMLAVTGACLMISRQVFDEIGGWDEDYQLNFSDVQLCLDVHARGYQVIYAADAQLIHYEGQTHQRSVPRADFLRASEKFAEWLERGDPSYHPALSYEQPLSLNENGHTPLELDRRVIQNLPPDEWIEV